MTDLDDLAKLAPKSFDTADILDGDTEFHVDLTDADDPLLILCVAFISGESDQFGIYSGEAPDAKDVTDLEDYTERVLSGRDITFDKSSEFKGGTLLPYCSVAKDSSSGERGAVRDRLVQRRDPDRHLRHWQRRRLEGHHPNG